MEAVFRPPRPDRGRRIGRAFLAGAVFSKSGITYNWAHGIGSRLAIPMLIDDESPANCRVENG